MQRVSIRQFDPFNLHIYGYGHHHVKDTIVIPGQRRETAAPSPVQVAGNKLLTDIENHLRRFVFIDNEYAYSVMAVWAVHSHVYLWQDATPRLHYVANKPNQGKSAAMRVLRPICSGTFKARSSTGKRVPRGGYFTGRGTGAGLLGLVNQTGDIEDDIYDDEGMLIREKGKYHGTIMLDDYDSIFERSGSADILSVFKIGYTPNNYETKMKGGDVIMQETYIPMAIAGIQSSHLDRVSLSRCITFHMRAPVTEEEFPEESYAPKVHDRIGNRFHDRVKNWATFIEDALPEMNPQIPGLINRDREIWKPLVAIAEFAGEEWANRMRAAAIFFTTGKDPEPVNEADRIVLKVQSILEDWEEEKLPTELILRQMRDEGFPEINSHQLNAALNAKGISQRGRVTHPEKPDTRVRGYALEDIRAALMG